MGGLQKALEFFEVVVREDADGCAAQTGGIDETGVAELVEDDCVARADQRGDGAEWHGEAAAEGERCLGAFEICESFLQCGVGAMGAAHQTRSAGAAAVAGDAFGEGPLHLGGAGQAEVVVGGKIDPLAVVRTHGDAVHFIEWTQITPQALRTQFIELRGDVPRGGGVLLHASVFQAAFHHIILRHTECQRFLIVPARELKGRWAALQKH